VIGWPAGVSWRKPPYRQSREFCGRRAAKGRYLCDRHVERVEATAALLRRDGPSALPRLTSITLPTPQAEGFIGIDARDFDRAAGHAFAAAYGEAKIPARLTEVRFVGGLVDPRTGREDKEALTASYNLRRADAQRIDWAHEENVDWSTHRVLISPDLAVARRE
jgi:hypothetical protein